MNRRQFLNTTALVAGGLMLKHGALPLLGSTTEISPMKTIAKITLPRNLTEHVAPGRSALLVYDMQAGIVPAVQDSVQITNTVAHLVESAHSNSVPVFFSRHYALPLRWCGQSQLRAALRFQPDKSIQDLRPHLLKGSPECELVQKLLPTSDDMVFDKLGMSFFVGTPLEFCLRDLGIATVVMTGCVAEIGILPTVLHAADLGFYPVTVSDACGSLNKENHKSVMENLGSIGTVVDAEQVLAAWRASA